MLRQRLQQFDMAKTARQLAATAAADTHEIFQRRPFQGDMTLAGMHHQIAGGRKETQMGKVLEN